MIRCSYQVLSDCLPADAEYELIGAILDPVPSLHVGHELCAVTVDGENGVTRTQVTLGCLAARSHLQEGGRKRHEKAEEEVQILI